MDSGPRRVLVGLPERLNARENALRKTESDLAAIKLAFAQWQLGMIDAENALKRIGKLLDAPGV
jgi:hypothetical protein